jgi:predicted nucleotidyltransferase component of viral defense system
VTLPDPVRLEASVRSRTERLADERAGGDRAARQEWIVRLRRELAYRRLLTRLATAQPGGWFLKGGLALQFRLDPSRSTLDIDIGLLGGLQTAAAEAALRKAASLDLGDRFAFEVGRPRQSRDDHALTIPVDAYIGAQRFEQFRVDLAPPRDNTPTESAGFTFVALGIPELDEHPAIRVIALSQQIAEKVCAIFERRGDAHSSRARDLADIAAIAIQVDGIDGTEVIDALRREAKRRGATLADGLPTTFELARPQAEEWARRWATLIRQPPIDFDQSLETARVFLNPVLRGNAAGAQWASARAQWL